MTLKLEYFPIRGLAEYTRTLLIDIGIEFIDERISFEEWPSKKESMPLEQMPVLTEGDKKIPQSAAILRHLARTYGELISYGSTECEHTYLDVFQEALKDLDVKYATMAYQDWDGKEKFDKETYPVELAKIEKLYKTRGGKFILGDKISFVDYILFEELELALASNSKNLDTVPVLKAYHERFLERPNLKDYFAKRASDKVPFMGNGTI